MKSYHIIAILPAFLLYLLTLFTWNSQSLAILHGVSGLAYLFSSGTIIAKYLFPARGLSALLLAPLSALLPMILLGSVTYFLFNFASPIPQLIALLPLAITAWLITKEKASAERELPRSLSAHTRALSVVFLALFIAEIALLLASQTTISVLGPWDVIPSTFFIFYFLATLILISMAFVKTPPSYVLSFTCLHFFSSFGILALVLPLTYGFDPLLHQAGELRILHDGVILPKQPYYVGWYVAVVELTHLLGAPITIVHNYLLPLLASMSIPALIMSVMQKKIGITVPIMSLGIFLIPFSPLTSATPWGFAFFLFLLTLFLIFDLSHNFSRSKIAPLILLSLVICAIHPLAGIPAVGICMITILVHYAYNCTGWKQMLLGSSAVIVTLLSSMSLVVALGLSATLEPHIRTAASLDWNAVLSWLPSIPTRFRAWLDMAYLSFYSSWFFLLLSAVYGAVVYYRSREKKIALGTITTLLLAGIILGINALIVGNFITFGALASNEQQDYAQRLISLASLVLLPFALLALSRIVSVVFSSPSYPLIRMGCLLLFSGVVTANLYLSYPKADAYFPYHGYSISQGDRDAVRWIDADSGDRPIIVLANQMVAGASLREVGFRRYFTMNHNGVSKQVFYYALPGSPLTPYFEAMVKNPSPNIMEKAMDLVHVDHAYFVVTPYQPLFTAIVERAKENASDWRQFRGTYVFKYER